MGKTLLALALICYRRKLKELKSCLVLVPNRTNKTEWAQEIEKHTSLDYLVLRGSTKDKWEALDNTTAPVIVETYGGFARLCSTIVKNKKGKNKLKPNLPLVKQLMKKVNGLVLDESTLIKTRGTLANRICKKVGKDACMLIELTGTPFGRDPTDLWGQINLLDDGHSLGETLGLFRAAFFTEKMNYWGGREYKFKESMTETLHKFIGHCTINYEADEADLPSVLRDVKSIRMPEKTYEYFEAQLAELKRAQKGHDNAGMKNSFIRLRQLSSGWLGFKDDNGKSQVVFPTNPKLDLLASFVERIPAKHKFIVFHDFNLSGKIVFNRLHDMGIRCAHLWGGTKDPDTERAKYDKDEVQGLILSNAFGYGLNLQAARYGLFFESPVPVIMRKQCERRYIRQGSTIRHKFLTDFVMRGTFDQAILKWHKEGGDLFKAIVRGEFDIKAP
jgi:SNF2 family DNA or RNA helicase